MHFGNQDFCINICSIYIKFCSVVLSKLFANSFQVTRLNSKRRNTLALYAFPTVIKLHVFDYMIITYGYFNIWSWNKDHATQHEMAIPIIYRYIQNTQANYRKIVIKWLKTLK